MNIQILSMWKKIINYFFSWTTAKTFFLVTLNYIMRILKGAWWLFFIVMSSLYVHLAIASVICFIAQFFIIILLRPSLERKDAAYVRRFLHYMSMYVTYQIILLALTGLVSFIHTTLAGGVWYAGQFIGYFALLFLCDDVYIPRHQWRELGITSVRAWGKSVRFIMYTFPVTVILFFFDVLSDSGIAVLIQALGAGTMKDLFLHGVLAFFQMITVLAMCVTCYTKVRYTQEQFFLS